MSGAPTKLNSVIIKAINDVINTDINAIILTDEELCLLANEQLDDFDKFSYSTFKDWKAHILGYQSKQDKEVPPENQALYDKLGSVIKKALILQKQNLFTALRNQDEKAWTRYAWIIERKFSQWNLTQKQEIAGKDGTPLGFIFEVIDKTEDVRNTDDTDEQSI